VRISEIFKAKNKVREERKKLNGYWNGEPALIRKCRFKMKDEPAFRMFWGKDLVGTVVDAVEVTYESDRFYLYDGDGSGFYKVTGGMGSPSVGHKSCTPDGEVKYI